MKKRIILYSSIFAILLFIILIIGNYFYNFNAFAADSIKIPQIEKYDIEIYKIEKYKVWEMKNVYLYNGDYVFDKKKNGKIIENRFFMVNKKVQNINSFFNQFIKITNIIQTKNDETLIKFYFYLESKKLPRYWKPVWDIRYIDELSEHKEDLLFVITTDNNLNIENIDANDGI